MKYKITLLTVLSSILLSANQALANEFDLRLSDDTVQAGFSIESDTSDVMYGLGYLYKDEDETINVLNIDLHAKGQTAIANMPTTVGIGFQGNVFEQDEFKGSAIGIGGSARINIPEAPGLSIEAEAHYAPNILAFSDADAFTRLRIQTNYRIIQSADVSFGYRYLNAGIEEGGDTTLESGVYVGMKLKF